MSPLMKIDSLIRRGKSVLPEDKWEAWYQLVEIRVGELRKTMELEYALDIIDVLNTGGTMGDAKEILDNQNHMSPLVLVLVLTIVRNFAERGQEFCDWLEYTSQSIGD